MSAVRPETEGAPRVSVIIPVYNGERFLRRCLDSVLGQSMADLELIAVNDGSTDSSLEILGEYAARDPRVTVIDQPNAGQGAARNRAIDLARGEYVLFVDADDFIERVTLQVTTERAEEDSSDLVHFDWKFASSDPAHPERFNYYNIEPFWHHPILRGAECEILLQMHSYFSVINLYRRSFLERHAIRYEVGQIYEDNPFLAKVFTRAETVSLVHSPLYVIQANPESSTKTGGGTDRHMRDHLAAVRKSFDALEPRRAASLGELAEYHLEKFSIYYMRRVPKRLRNEYAREFVSIVSEQNPSFQTYGRATSWLTRLCERGGVFDHQRPGMLQRAVEMKAKAVPTAKRLLSGARKAKRRLRNPRQTLAALLDGRNPSIRSRSILFLGFDGRYTGNSRALFEMILADERFRGFQVQFATTDSEVPELYRIAPGSPAFFQAARSAETVIAETWIPEAVPKHPDSTWIQLWHGTPIKRMLFDSHEREITKQRPQHKVNKYRDILRWDYLLVENEYAASKFETAFLFPRERMIFAQYPRVAQLVKDAHAGVRREHTRRQLGLADDDYVILYAPTWRDYNYGVPEAERDTSYLLDVTRFAERLGSTCRVLVKQHSYLGTSSWQHTSTAGTVLGVNGEAAEDLLLVSNCLVSDFSSILFDAEQLGVPSLIYAVDRNRFEASRGLYVSEALRHARITLTEEDAVSTVLEFRESPTPVQIEWKSVRPESHGNSKLIQLMLNAGGAAA